MNTAGVPPTDDEDDFLARYRAAEEFKDRLSGIPAEFLAPAMARFAGVEMPDTKKEMARFWSYRRTPSHPAYALRKVTFEQLAAAAQELQSTRRRRRRST